MEVTIMTGLFTEGDVDINHGDKYTKTISTSPPNRIFSSFAVGPPKHVQALITIVKSKLLIEKIIHKEIESKAVIFYLAVKIYL